MIALPAAHAAALPPAPGHPRPQPAASLASRFVIGILSIFSIGNVSRSLAPVVVLELSCSQCLAHPAEHGVPMEFG